MRVSTSSSNCAVMADGSGIDREQVQFDLLPEVERAAELLRVRVFEAEALLEVLEPALVARRRRAWRWSG